MVHVHNFHGQVEAMKKMLLFLELIIVALFILMVEIKILNLTAEAKYSINFAESGKQFVLSLHYNGSNSFLWVNKKEIYQFKANDWEIKPYVLSLGTIGNMKKKQD